MKYLIVLDTHEFEPDVARNIQYRTGKMKYSFRSLRKERMFDSSPRYGSGFHFTDIEHIRDYYMHGVWLREVTPIGQFTIIKDGLYKIDEMILSERHSLVELSTYEKFQIPLPTLRWFVWFDFPELIEQLYTQQTFEQNTSPDPVDYAMWKGNVAILDLLDRLLTPDEFIYSERGAELASKQGHINVLNWFVSSEKELKYSHTAIENAMMVGNLEVVEWWLQLSVVKFDKSNIDHILTYTTSHIQKLWNRYEESKKLDKGKHEHEHKHKVIMNKSLRTTVSEGSW
jgi:hypothetical protein